MWGMIVKVPNLSKVFHEYEQELYDNMNKFGFAVVREAKRKAPVYRGLLRNRIVHEVKKTGYPFDIYVRVFVPAKDERGYYYAKVVEFGSKPHRPPFEAIYRWVWLKRRDIGVSDKEVEDTAWAVWHKIAERGTKPHPFLRPSAKKVLKTWRWWK